MSDYPLQECAAAAEKILAKNKAVKIYQKWTCAKCGARVTANQPNVFTTMGHHEDCDGITDIAEQGCNYMVISKAMNLDDIDALFNSLFKD